MSMRAVQIEPGTLFELLTEEWICLECGKFKDWFIEA
jgi:rubredoxin